MSTIYVDTDKCKGCGLCAEQCRFNQTIKLSEGKAVYNDESGKCIKCFHCLKVCPNNAIYYNGGAVVYDSGDRASSAIWRRSCRKYSKKELDKELISRVINEANTASIPLSS